MIKRQYVISAQICHANRTGDKEYYNGILTIKSWFRPSGEDVIATAREIVVDKLKFSIDRVIYDLDVQIIALNRI